MTTELVIRPDQTRFDDNQVAALRALGVEDAPPGDVALLFHQSVRTGLDPFAKQIYLIGRGGREQVNGQWRDSATKKWTIQTGIEGYRVIRDRISAEHPERAWLGQVEQWCGDDGVWKDVWLSNEPPAAARVLVYIAGKEKPVPGVALWREYAATDRNGNPQAMWKKMPANQLLKCAEAAALRKAYPQDLGGMYVDAEMEQADVGADGVPAVTRVQPAQNSRQVAPKPAVNRGKTGNTPDLKDLNAVADEWATRARSALTLTDARTLYREAHQRGILDYPLTSGEMLEDVLRARGEQLADEEAHAAAEEMPPALDGIEDDA